MYPGIGQHNIGAIAQVFRTFDCNWTRNLKECYILHSEFLNVGLHYFADSHSLFLKENDGKFKGCGMPIVFNRKEWQLYGAEGWDDRRFLASFIR